MNVRDKFVEGSLKAIKADGSSEASIRRSLEACWAFSASIAFNFPSTAEAELGDTDKRVFASSVFHQSLLKTYQKLYGKLPKDQLDDLADFLCDTEDIMPYMRLDIGKLPDWIIGKRSLN